MMREVLTRRFSRLRQGSMATREPRRRRRRCRGRGVPSLARPRPHRRRPGPADGGARASSPNSASPTASWRSASPRGRTATPAASASSCRAASRFTLPPRDPVLYFVQRLRDEAHRFAIGSHRARRKKEMVAQPARRDRRHRPDPQARAAAAFRHRQGGQPRRRSTTCMAVDGISEAVARLVYDHFHEN